MKAVRVHAVGAAPQLDDIAAPSPAPGSSLVRMAAATVGHIDRTVWQGAFFVHPPWPYVPGVEAAGTIIESARFPPGQRVWLRGGGLGTRIDGTWRECIAAPDDALGALPDGVSFALGAAFFSPCTSAWVALHEVGRLQAGQSLLVTGATGAEGSIAAQLGREHGARVLAVVSDAAQAARLPAGVEPMLLADLAPTADLLVDTVGGVLLPRALAGVRAGGRAVLVGYTAGHETTLNLPELLQRDVALLPLNMIRREQVGRGAVGDLLARLADGRLRLEVRPFALPEAERALAWIAERGHRGRAVLVPG